MTFRQTFYGLFMGEQDNRGGLIARPLLFPVILYHYIFQTFYGLFMGEQDSWVVPPRRDPRCFSMQQAKVISWVNFG